MHVVDSIGVASRAPPAGKSAHGTVCDEAAAEGIEIELMRTQPNPLHVFGSPRREGHRQVFYVHLLMPHEDGDAITQDVWTIDADDADMLADYLRDRTLPELRSLRARFGVPIAA